MQELHHPALELKGHWEEFFSQSANKPDSWQRHMPAAMKRLIVVNKAGHLIGLGASAARLYQPGDLSAKAARSIDCDLFDWHA